MPVHDEMTAREEEMSVDDILSEHFRPPGCPEQGKIYDEMFGIDWDVALGDNTSEITTMIQHIVDVPDWDNLLDAIDVPIMTSADLSGTVSFQQQRGAPPGSGCLNIKSHNVRIPLKRCKIHTTANVPIDLMPQLQEHILPGVENACARAA